MPQKKVKAIAAPTTPRTRCSRTARRPGQAWRVASHNGPASSTPIALRTSSAL